MGQSTLRSRGNQAELWQICGRRGVRDLDDAAKGWNFVCHLG